MEFQKDEHYFFHGRADRVRFFTDSADYYAALADVIPRAHRRILVVGWCFDDRIHLLRDAELGAKGASVGEMLIAAAKANPTLRVHLRIWDAPSFFSGDQHFSELFLDEVRSLPNMRLEFVTTESVFATAHEKYLVVDDVLAFIGGIDISLNRWDTPDHRALNRGRTNPRGERYNPYHDTHAAITGPLVRELLALGEADNDKRSVREPILRQSGPPLWPENVPVDVTNASAMFALTRSYTDPDRDDIRQIQKVYIDLIREAKEFIYIENQYFSSDRVTGELVRRLQQEDTPEVLIIMSRELPDALGRWTMGVNASMHLARLFEADTHQRLGFYNLFSPDSSRIDIKVHSKLMIVDSRYVTLGSANVNRRSFGFDSEANLVIDAHETDEPDCVRYLEYRILAQHCGISPAQWQQRVHRHGGSRLAVFRERSDEWTGISEGRDFPAPDTVPREILDYFDMGQAPQSETIFHTLARESPMDIVSRTKRAWGLVLAPAIVLGGVFLLSRAGIEIEQVLHHIEQINTTRPIIAGALTIVTYWLTMALLVTIVVPVVFFAALHGPWWGILYSVAGLFTGAAIFYGLGLALYNSEQLDRYRVIRRAKDQLEKIKPYGTWAVAVSRMVPTGPFMVVNLVTGMVGFTPGQFLLGSAIGLLPGIVAFSIFGEIIRNVITDPGLVNTLWFILFFLLYFLLVRGILATVRRVAGWIADE